ncbi:DUF1254 domain-containing protein, partial [bacterium]|nr:DUF1254 domain-containing protein [bacterium]
MKTSVITVTILLFFAVVFNPIAVKGESDHYEKLAGLQFCKGYPTDLTSRTLEEELFFQRAVQTYLWALPAANMSAMKEGQAKLLGEGYNVFAIFEKRLKANTLIATPNSDVIYGIGFLDLGKDGPMVIDAPPMMQALIDDFWHRAIEGPEIDGIKYFADIGLPGPDRGKGGKYLVLPPAYKGPVDEYNYFVYRSKTNGVFVFMRGFFRDPNNLEPAVANMERLKVYPLTGKAQPMLFKHVSELDANYLFPATVDYFTMLNHFIQSDVVDNIDPYMHGMMAAIGIEKGKPFSPSPRELEILNAAAGTAWKMAKNIAANFDREEGAVWYKDRYWIAHTKTDLENFFGTFLNIEYNRHDTGHTDVNAKAHMFINHYSASPGMITSRVEVGAKYGGAYKDSNGDYLDGGNSYKLTLPANVPVKLFWSITVYDAVTAAGIDNGQDFPSIGLRDNPVQNADGSTTLYFGPKAP